VGLRDGHGDEVGIGQRAALPAVVAGRSRWGSGRAVAGPGASPSPPRTSTLEHVFASRPAGRPGRVPRSP
jgi:hypothetical protein